MLSVDEPSVNEEMKLVGLISSRICHDLISPIGAIGNGMELLELSGAAGGEEMELIRDCAGTAAAALKFLRIAFGDRDEFETIASAELFDILEGHLGPRKVVFEGRATAPFEIAFGPAKALMLMAMTAASAAPRGCVLSLLACGADPLDAGWRMRSDAIMLSERARVVIDGAPPLAEVTPGEAHLLLLHMMAARRGAALSWTNAPDGAELRVR